MGGTAIGNYLQQYAANAPDMTSIVELGTWLGAGTEQLALGIAQAKKNIHIHTYDWFQIHGNEVGKAAAFSVAVEDGQDSLPLVKKYLSPIPVEITYHKCEITEQNWNGRKISVHVDDACKYEKQFVKALKIFSPHWIPGKTIVVLMDYYFYLWRPKDPALKFQSQFIQAHRECFEHLADVRDYCVAIFRYLGGLEV